MNVATMRNRRKRRYMEANETLTVSEVASLSAEKEDIRHNEDNKPRKMARACHLWPDGVELL